MGTHISQILTTILDMGVIIKDFPFYVPISVIYVLAHLNTFFPTCSKPPALKNTTLNSIITVIIKGDNFDSRDTF